MGWDAPKWVAEAQIPKTSAPVDVDESSVFYAEGGGWAPDFELFMGRVSTKTLRCAVCKRRTRDIVTGHGFAGDVQVNRFIAFTCCSRCKEAAKVLAPQLIANHQVKRARERPSGN